MKSAAVCAIGRQSSSGMYPIRERTATGSCRGSASSTVVLPTVGRRIPRRMRMRVVLPAPLAPTSPIRPLGMVTETWWRATWSP